MSLTNLLSIPTITFITIDFFFKFRYFMVITHLVNYINCQLFLLNSMCVCGSIYEFVELWERSRKVYENLPSPKSLLLSLYQVSLVFGGRRHRWRSRRRRMNRRKGGKTIGVVRREHGPPELCSGFPKIYDVIARSSVIREPRPLLPSSLSRLST